MVEVLAYQLGIRLEFARNEHRHADPSGDVDVDREFTAQDIDFAVNSFRALAQAFDELAGATKCAPGTMGPGTRLINLCLSTWNDWSNLCFDYFKSDEVEVVETDSIHDYLDQLVNVIERVLDYAPTSAALQWFALGRDIGESPEDDDTLTKKARQRLQEMKLSVEQLFPSISHDRESRKLLPYDPESHWRWFRIEAGLNALKLRAGQMESQRAPDVPPTNRSGDARESGAAQSDQLLPPPDAPPDKPPRPEYLGLYIDEDRCEIVRGEKRIPLTRQEPLKLLRILIKNKETVSNYEALTEAPKTGRGAVHATKCQLDKLLREVGIQIKNVRGVGYRLVELPP